VDAHPENDAAALEVALRSLLARYANAPVVAIAPDSTCVPMPASVPLSGQQVLEARSALDLVVNADKMAVITAWELAKATGSSTVPVRLVSNPHRQGEVHLLDLQERHGIVLGLFAAGADTEGREVQAVPPAPPVRPRFSQMRKDQLAVVLEVDHATTQMLGWSSEEMVGRRSLDFIHPDDQVLGMDNWMELLTSPGPARRVRLRHRRSDDSWVWIEVTNHNLLEDPDYGCVLAEMADITEEMATQEALRAREQLLHRLAEALPLGVLQLDSRRRIVYANDRLHRIVGTEPATTVDDQLSTVIVEDQPLLESSLDDVLRESIDADIEVQLLLPASQELRSVTMSLRALTNDVGSVTGAIICVADVTDGARMRDELKMRATFDVLTGCHNRASIMSELETILGREGSKPAVIFVDLDGFKTVNDKWGHAAGDELLTIVATRLSSAVRAGDLVGRIGGDEFLAVCPDIDSAEAAMKLATRMAETLDQSAALKAAIVELRASIGVAWAHTSDADALVAQADAAMYEAKRHAQARPVLYSLTLRSRGADVA
jgi:diguanylate cyclase (GGDEF)-like protein/PAS domain S-box-containing protein